MVNEGTEERARRMGWVPKDEFKGDPEVWRDADEFVKRGEEMLGIAKERNRALDTRIQELEKTIKQFTDFHRKTEERAYERAKKEYALELQRIQDEMDNAVKDGDARKVRELVKERDELAPPEKEAPTDQTPPTAFLEWHKDNPWYTTQGHETPKGDKRLSKYADKIALFLLEDPEFKYTPDDVEFYEAVRQEVESRFPEHFENPRQGEQRVEGTGTPRRRKGSGKKTAADLPAEDRAQMKRFIKEGLISEEEFLKEYEWDEE